MDGVNAWARLPGETARAYEAFRAYLELGSARTLDGACGATRGPQGGRKRAPGNCRRWASDHRWAERARAWDEYLSAREMEATARAHEALAISRAEKRERVDDEAWEVSRRLIARGREMLDWPLAEDELTISEDGTTTTIVRTPVRWGMRDAIRALMLGDQLARLAVGMPPRGVAESPTPQSTDGHGDLNANVPPGLAEAQRRLAADYALRQLGLEGAAPDEGDDF